MPKHKSEYFKMSAVEYYLTEDVKKTVNPYNTNNHYNKKIDRFDLQP